MTNPITCIGWLILSPEPGRYGRAGQGRIVSVLQEVPTTIPRGCIAVKMNLDVPWATFANPHPVSVGCIDEGVENVRHGPVTIEADQEYQ